MLIFFQDVNVAGEFVDGGEECLNLGLAPGALSEDLVQAQGHGLAGDQTLHLGLQLGGQHAHQGLGSEAVLGTLLVVALGQVLEQAVGGLVDVVDDLAQVALEVAGGQRLEVGEGLGGGVSLPLQFALPLVDNSSELGVLGHVGLKGLGELELVSGGGDLAAGQGEVLLVLFRGGILGQDGGLAQVGGEANDVEVLVDIVHDLGLQEGLGSVVHDLVAELGLGNVLSQLLDASAAGLGGSVFVDNLVTLPLGGLAVGKLSHQLLDHLKLTSEEGILGPVHPEEVQVDTGDGLDESLVGGGQLELSEEAGGHAAGGGSGETDLAVDNDGAVDGGALQSLAKSVEVSLSGGSRVADGDPLVDQAGELLLEPLNDQGEGGQFLDLHLVFRLVDVDVLELAIVALGATLHNSHELLLVLLDGVTSDIAELGVLSN